MYAASYKMNCLSADENSRPHYWNREPLIARQPTHGAEIVHRETYNSVERSRWISCRDVRLRGQEPPLASQRNHQKSHLQANTYCKPKNHFSHLPTSDSYTEYSCCNNLSLWICRNQDWPKWKLQPISLHCGYKLSIAVGTLSSKSEQKSCIIGTLPQNVRHNVRIFSHICTYVAVVLFVKKDFLIHIIRVILHTQQSRMLRDETDK